MPTPTAIAITAIRSNFVKSIESSSKTLWSGKYDANPITATVTALSRALRLAMPAKIAVAPIATPSESGISAHPIDGFVNQPERDR